MKKIFVLVLLAWSFYGCKSDQAPTEAEQSQAPGIDPGIYKPAPAGPGSFRSPIPVPITSREAQVLTQQYWVFEYYIDPQTPTNNRPNRGRWYKINPDGTFESGHWDKKTAQGSWGLGRSEDQQFVTIHFDSSLDAEDSEYMIQGINDQDDAMSWVGTDYYGQGHIMVKVIKLLTMPTKKQFGVEE